MFAKVLLNGSEIEAGFRTGSVTTYLAISEARKIGLTVVLGVFKDVPTPISFSSDLYLGVAQVVLTINKKDYKQTIFIVDDRACEKSILNNSDKKLTIGTDVMEQLGSISFNMINNTVIFNN
uniref:Uncharacterized protein n=1 Tax=Ditylenchus dipsaci TaxID=166011 RepID=A0A915EVE8_9BILA